MYSGFTEAHSGAVEVLLMWRQYGAGEAMWNTTLTVEIQPLKYEGFKVNFGAWRVIYVPWKTIPLLQSPLKMSSKNLPI
jgi:hypothetical protein